HFIAPAVPDAFLAVDRIKSPVALVIKLHVVEDEKFGLWSEGRRLSKTRVPEVLLASLSNAPRIASVSFLGAGLSDGAGQRESRHGAEGVDESGGRVRHGQHVGSFDRFPAADGRPVEAKTVLEDFQGQFADRHAEMLPGAKGVDEFHIHHPGSLLAGHLHYAFGITHG